MEDGKLLGCGANGDGQLGLNHAGGHQLPILIAENVEDISAGNGELFIPGVMVNSMESIGDEDLSVLRRTSICSEIPGRGIGRWGREGSGIETS